MNKKISFIAMFVILSLLLTSCNQQNSSSSSDATVSEKQEVTILSANYDDRIALQLEYLRAKYPDADINITYMSSGNLAAKLLTEGHDTTVDIAMSLSSGYANSLKEEGLLLAFENETSYNPEYADASNMVLPNGVWCGAILVNTVELERLQLPEPESYADLLNPIYRGHIVMCDPNVSATGYFYLLGLLNMYGEEEGWNYFDQLHASGNIKVWGNSGSIPSSMVEMGEAVIGLGMDYEGMRLESEGKPVKVVFPEEGVPFDYDTALLIDRGTEPSDFVLDVFRTITSAEGNDIFNNYNIAVLAGQDNRIEYPEHFALLDMQGITDATVKTSLTDAWRARYE